MSPESPQPRPGLSLSIVTTVVPEPEPEPEPEPRSDLMASDGGAPPDLAALFERRAALLAGSVAVRAAGGDATFAQLAARSDALAQELRRSGVGAGCAVALCCADRTVGSTVGMLGILGAGAAFVPVSPSDPPARVAAVLAQAGASVAVVQLERPAAARLLGTFRGTLVRLDADGAADAGSSLPAAPAGRAAVGAGAAAVADPLPAAVACVMFTSGSTGGPKGVLGTHAGLLNRCAWYHEAYPLLPDDVCAVRTAATFVDSLAELFAPLLFGPRGCVVALVSGPIALDGARLPACIAQYGVTRLVLVPALLGTLLDALEVTPADGQSLRVVSVSGEELPAELCAQFRRILPACTLLNLYGSTEVSGDVTCCDVTQLPSTGSSPVPIGRPIANCEVLLLDEHSQVILEAGQVGELFVGGPHVAAGYLSAPQLTQERFIQSELVGNGLLFRTGDRARRLDDGAIVWMGRSDRQVKLRGQRIELDEVEAAIRAGVDGIEAVAVLIHEERLLAFVSPESMLTTEVRRSCLEHLPAYMTPESIAVVSRLPTTAAGKLDRQALIRVLATPHRVARTKALHAADAQQVAVERAVAALWRELLGLDDAAPARGDSWFEMGGTSLQAVGMIERLRAAVASIVGHCAELSFTDVYATPTVAGLSATALRHCRYSRGGDSPPAKRARTGAAGWAETKALPKSDSELQLHAVHTALVHDGATGWIMAAGAVSHTNIGTPGDASWIDDCLRQPTSQQKGASFDPSWHLRVEWKHNAGKCIDGAPVWLLGEKAEDGAVIVASHSGVVAAVSVATGRDCWRTQLPGRVDAAVSICMTGAGELLACIGSYNGSVYFLRVADGTIAWEFRTGEEVKCCACVEPGQAHGGSTVWVGSHDRCCYALSVCELPGRCVYRLTTQGNVIGRPYCTDAMCCQEEALRVIISSQDGTIRTIVKRRDASTGTATPRTSCSADDDPTLTEMRSSLSLQAGASSYGVSWETPLGAPVFAGVVTVGGLVICADVTGVVHGLMLTTGTARWTTQCGIDGTPGGAADGAFVTPTVVGGGDSGDSHAILVPLRSGLLVCLSAADGVQLWTTCIAPAALTAVGVDKALSSAAMGTIICVAAADGSVVICRVRTAGESAVLEEGESAVPEEGESFRVLARFTLPGALFCPPLMHGSRVILGCRDDHLYSLACGE